MPSTRRPAKRARRSIASAVPTSISSSQQQNQRGKRVSGDYWEVAKVLGRRKHKGRIEYLIRWKDCPESDNTWEPASSLADSAHAEAVKFNQQEKLRRQKLEENERKLGLRQKNGAGWVGSRVEELEVVDSEGNVIPVNTDADMDVTKPEEFTDNDDSKPDDVRENGPWGWTDQEQVIFRTVERIDVNDPEARKLVTEARVNGVPVVLTGHVGWADFAKRWLKAEDDAQTINNDQKGPYCDSKEPWLDLSKPHELDVSRMMNDIDREDVPVIKRDYNEENPIEATIAASTFLGKCWPPADDTRHLLYLHQWQFPLSDTAGRLLCHQNQELPNNILGDDLLKYWLDLPQCTLDSPFQYLFMGRENTMSKLHRDNGGLAISIAPIVGEKECILVHRSDGASCLYHLTAPLDQIDLESYPLMAHARIWKTTIRPGEILLMPHGTYHQCRNLTPCLSYSRFHLDTVNLLPFLQSMLDGDAPEIEHDEVLWNVTQAYIKKVEAHVDQVQREIMTKQTDSTPTLTQDMVQTVDTLRALRNICKEVGRRVHLWQTARGNSGKAHPSMSKVLALYKSARRTKTRTNRASLDVSAEADCTTWQDRGVHHWDILVDDVDSCLHEFRYRLMKEKPKKWVSRIRSVQAEYTERQKRETELEQAFKRLPNVSSTDREVADDFAIEVGDTVVVHWLGKSIRGNVLQVESQMGAAYLSYDDYPQVYDEYHPFEKLRMPVCGEASDEIRPEDIKPGLHVVELSEGGDEYRAVVQSTSLETFYKIRLRMGRLHCDRWLKRHYIIERRQSESSNDEHGVLSDDGIIPVSLIARPAVVVSIASNEATTSDSDNTTEAVSIGFPSINTVPEDHMFPNLTVGKEATALERDTDQVDSATALKTARLLHSWTRA